MSAFPSEIDILQQVRAIFIARGETLTHWCRANRIDPARAWRVLRGQNVGKKGLALRERILREAKGSVNEAA